MKKITPAILITLIVVTSGGLFMNYRDDRIAKQKAFDAALDTTNLHRTRVLLDQKLQIKTALIKANLQEPNKAVDMANAEISRIDSELKTRQK